MRDTVAEWVRCFASHVWTLISGIFMMAVGYLFPIKDIIHLIIFFFILDVIFGYWAARRLRGEKFSAKIIWNTTIPRMLVVLVIIISAFLWDSVFNQSFIATYKVIGYFISGVILASIVQNAYNITEWPALTEIGSIIKIKIKEKTGIKINNRENKENK